MLKLFYISICFIMALNAVVFVLAGIWAADVETMSFPALVADPPPTVATAADTVA